MRTVLLTTVAAAALAAASFQVVAQDNMPSTSKSPPAESKQPPATQQMNAAPEKTGRSATAPSEESGAAKQEMKSQKGSAEKVTPGAATKEQKAQQGPAQPSTGKEPKTTQGGTGEQGAQPATGATTHPKGTAAETKPAPSATTGSAAPGASEQRGKAMEKGQSATTTQGGTERTPGAAPSTGRSATTGQAPEQAPGNTVTLNSRQQTEVRGALANERVQNIDRVDFSVTTGTIVPAYVSIQPLPDRIVGIVPEYRGYDYAMVRSDIVIIEPRTRRIVTVLKGQGRAEGRSAVSTPNARLHLTSKQRQLIRQDLESKGTAIHQQFRLGQRVPEDVSFSTMPTTVVTEIPDLRSYSYFVTDEAIVLVEPDTREVVEVVR